MLSINTMKQYQNKIIYIELLKIIIVIFMFCFASVSSDYLSSKLVNYGVSLQIRNNDDLVNPYIGLAPWGYKTSYPQHHTLVFADATWKELEPTKGEYDFEKFEKYFNFEYWGVIGKKIILSFNMDYPGEIGHKDIPDWLYEEINREGTFYTTSDNKHGGFSPNYKNPILIKEHRRLIAAISKRYDSDPRVFLICMGSVGHWGEMHTTYIEDKNELGSYPDESYSSQYEMAYSDLFNNIFVSSRYPRQIAKDKGMGLHNNSFGNPKHTYDWFIDWFQKGFIDTSTGDFHPAMPDFWEKAPSGGEFSNYPGSMWMNDDNISDTLNQVKQSHLSWLGPACMADEPVNDTYQKNLDKLTKTMGYRFFLERIYYPNEISKGNSALLIMHWENEGVAPFYYKWPLEISLFDNLGRVVYRENTTKDIRHWLPGSIYITFEMKISENIEMGEYLIGIAINDPNTKRPGLNIAIKANRIDERYIIGKLRVTD